MTEERKIVETVVKLPLSASLRQLAEVVEQYKKAGWDDVRLKVREMAYLIFSREVD